MIWPLSRKKEVVPLPPAPTLLSLTPEYEEARHGVYFAAIERALADGRAEPIRNIALSGGYGVGKSSILQKVAEKHPDLVALISMSTLGFTDSDPKAEGVAKTASTKTNRIQKEIVKQLLYGQDPVKMPGSRYRRITRFRFWREFGLAALLAVPMTLVFFLSGWSASLGLLARLPMELVDLANIPVYVLGIFFVLGVRKVMHNRIHIEKISTGGATIALSAQSATFFDEYLDEIVYFFERTKVEIVVFEDIDRFDDPHIFETLRSLNTLLNSAKQLEDRNIRFIYAIRDSIFEELGDRAAEEESSDTPYTGDQPTKVPVPASDQKTKDRAQAELSRANRTKFFDLVIPVVPFVTHRSARNHLKETLDKIPEHKVTDELIDRVGRHIADMRLIKNIANEFAIFHDRIIEHGSLNLTDDGVLAMVLYKNTHLADFEEIKQGSSSLDTLYKASRTLINDNIERLERENRETRRELDRLRPASIRSKRLGDALGAYLSRHVAHIGGTFVERGFSGEPLTDDALRTPEVWERIAAGETIQVSYTLQFSDQYRGTVNRTFVSTFTRDQLIEALGDPISPKDWTAAGRALLEKRIADAESTIRFLRHADMKSLAARADLSLTWKGTPQTFGHVIDLVLGSELAAQLVRLGYIDQNFTLYTATFPEGLLTVAATNFIMKNVEPNQIDMNFPLKSKDVEAILRDRGRTVLQERAAYNVSLLDHLLAKDSLGAKVLARKLAQYGNDEKAFLLAYLEAGKKPSDLIRQIAALWPTIFKFLITDAGLDPIKRSRLVDVALMSIGADLDYETDETVGNFLQENYVGLKSFASAKVSAATAKAIATLVSESGAEILALSKVSPAIREAIVDQRVYAVTRKNLELAIGERAPALALDKLKARRESVYDRSLDDLPSYLSSLHANEHTIAAAEALSQVVKDIVSRDVDQLESVLIRAAADVRLEDLADASTKAWPALAATARFPATFNNVVSYIDEIGLDENLAYLLVNAEEIQVDEETDEDAKLTLALTILGACAEIGSAAIRSGLVKSLHLLEFIDAASIPAEEGELVGCLIDDRVVEDSIDSFALIAPADWQGREYAISKSSDFKTFMTPAILPAADLGRLVGSTSIHDDVKSAVLDRFLELAPGASAQVLIKVADYAIASGHKMSIADITFLAGSIGHDRILTLLEDHLDSADLDQLAPILTAMGGDFLKVASATGKRPRFTKTDPLLALVARLEQLGVVSKMDDEGKTVRVITRRPE